MNTRHLIAAVLCFAAVIMSGCAGSANTSRPVIVSEPTGTAEPTASVEPVALEDLGLKLEPAWDGLREPLLVTHAGDGSGRQFIVEQGGRIRVVLGGLLQKEPYLDISDRVSTGGERGLLGLAFSPQFATSGIGYLNYTDRSGDTVIAAFRAAPGLLSADPESLQELKRIEQPYANHNGGCIAFGPDGYLYVGMGDGGSGGDPQGNAQDPDSLLGKMLRYQSTIEWDQGVGYAVAPLMPAPGNPFTVGSAAGQGAKEIWATGLRNPWRFSFDRQTGDLWIGDVGQNAWEEIDFQPAGSPGGENYGWNVLEGTHPYPPGAKVGSRDRFTGPVVEYDRDAGKSVTGGVVYRGARYPEMSGVYLYADYVTGRIWALRRGSGGIQNVLALDTDLSVSSFGEDEDGEVYVCDLGGAVYRVARTP